jgi:hypothetical protein
MTGISPNWPQASPEQTSELLSILTVALFSSSALALIAPNETATASHLLAGQGPSFSQYFWNKYTSHCKQITSEAKIS